MTRAVLNSTAIITERTIVLCRSSSRTDISVISDKRQTLVVAILLQLTFVAGLNFI